MESGENPGVDVLMNVIPAGLQPRRLDDGVEVERAGRTTRFRAIWAGSGLPGDVERVLQRAEAGAGGVVTARRFGQRAIRLLADRGCSWAAATGHAEIEADGIYIVRLDPKPLPSAAPPSMSWSPSARAIAEYLLSSRVQAKANEKEAADVGRLTSIADAIGISPGRASKVLLMFDREGYTSKAGPERGPASTRLLQDPGRLLTDWAAQYGRAISSIRAAQLHVLSRDPADWSTLVAERLSGRAWAASGWVGADALAPFATQLPDMIVYVPQSEFDGALAAMVADEDVEPVDRGGRIELRAAPPHVFKFVSRREGLQIASPVRVYADLLRGSGRAVEIADYLREVSIGF